MRVSWLISRAIGLVREEEVDHTDRLRAVDAERHVDLEHLPMFSPSTASALVSRVTEPTVWPWSARFRFGNSLYWFPICSCLSE